MIGPEFFLEFPREGSRQQSLIDLLSLLSNEEDNYIFQYREANPKITEQLSDLSILINPEIVGNTAFLTLFDRLSENGSISFLDLLDIVDRFLATHPGVPEEREEEFKEAVWAAAQILENVLKQPLGQIVCWEDPRNRIPQ